MTLPSTFLSESAEKTGNSDPSIRQKDNRTTRANTISPGRLHADPSGYGVVCDRRRLASRHMPYDLAGLTSFEPPKVGDMLRAMIPVFRV
jgi:hypothetical protein